MTREEFDRLVQRVENGVGRRPMALRARVALMAVIGYAGLLAWLAVVWGMAGLFFLLATYVDGGGKLACVIIGVAVLAGGSWAVLRVLLARLPPPEGREVTRAEAPGLYALLEELGGKLRSAPFHHVLILPDCNAAVVQVPRLGVLGWFRNYLLLGLPLMDGLTPEELRAVLAHEFAHLSREHGRTSRWIYRLRRSWEQVFEQLARPRVRGEVSFRPLILKFINWYWPRFNAMAFVLSRRDESEADLLASRLAGPENLASSLLRLGVYDRQIDEKFWPEIWKRANTEGSPPAEVFSALRDYLRSGPAPEESARWVEQAFSLSTTNADTHPCLTDRLRALGLLPCGFGKEMFLPIPPLPRTAAEVCLGGALEKIRGDVEQRWRKQCEAAWRERHARAGALQHRLSRLEEAVPGAAADVDSLWDKARVLLDLRGHESLEPLLREIIRLQPGHAAANFELGRLLLEAGRAEEGEACLERSMAENEQVVAPACELLHQHFRRAGRMDRVREIEARLDRYERDLAASRVECSSVTAADPLIPHDLNETELATLRQALAAEPELVAADVARKELRHFPKQKLFLVCVQRRRAWHRFPDVEAEQALVRRLSQAIRLPGRVLVFAPRGSFRALARKLRRVQGARVMGGNVKREA